MNALYYVTRLIRKRREENKNSVVTGVDNAGLVIIGGVAHDTKTWTEVQLETLPRELRTTELRE